MLSSDFSYKSYGFFLVSLLFIFRRATRVLTVKLSLCSSSVTKATTTTMPSTRYSRRARDNENVRYIFFEKTNNNHVGTIFNFMLWRTRSRHEHTIKRQYFEYYFLSFFFSARLSFAFALCIRNRENREKLQIVATK